MRCLRLLLKQILILSVTILLFTLSFRISLFDITGIFFYDGIIRMCFSIFVATVVEYLVRKYVKMDLKDICISVLLSLFVTFSFLSLVLVSLDRSYSVFLLSYMYDHYDEGEAIEAETLDNVMNSIFVEEYGMLDRRFEEQIVSGNIEQMSGGGGYALTENGERLVKIFQALGDIYGLDGKFTNP